MERARTLPEYRTALVSLLEQPASPLTGEETSALRAIVHRRRNGRRGEDGAPAPAPVQRRADEIVALLTDASRDLRPRETQELDDLVAGRAPREVPPPTVPVRLHRGGGSSR